MKIDVLTIFPEMFNPVTTDSMLGRAVRNGILDIRLTNIRDYTSDKHNKTDDYTFGGGGGMVMMPDPIFTALRHIGAEGKKVLYMSPRGKILDEQKVRELAGLDEFVILCGHYEGVDQRVLDYWNAEEVSIGDYVLTGGELPAMVLIDSVARFVPGVLGNKDSVTDESVYSGLLEYPHYTQPREYEGLQVPDVLLSGNHKKIDLWRFRESLIITKERRPDLFRKFIGDRGNLSKDEKKILDELLDQE